MGSHSLPKPPGRWSTIVVGVLALTVGLSVLAMTVGAPGFLPAFADGPTEPAVEVEQALRHFEVGGNNEANLTTVSLAHTGGDSIPRSSLEVVVNDDARTYNIVPADGLDESYPTVYEGSIEGYRDPCEAEQVCAFSAGQTLHVVTYGISRDRWRENRRVNYWDSGEFADGRYDGYIPFFIAERGPPGSAYPASKIVGGDVVRVDWLAASGNESEPVFRYTVQ